jgi:hypothetical protein
MQMADVVVQLRTERLDLRLPLVHLIGANAQLQEGTREVGDQEDDGVPHEGQPGNRHESGSRPEPGFARRGSLNGRHSRHPLSCSHWYSIRDS